MGKNGINHNPISDIEDDKLGFGEMAKHLAEAFMKNDLSRGFVIGVEGTWGSGKSSLVNLALNELDPKQVVRFSPWLVGNREGLLHQYFLDLDNAIRKFLPKDIRDKTRKLMKTYSALALGTAKMSEILSMAGVPGTGMLAKGLELTGGKAKELSAASLGKLNLELRDNLKKLKKPIIVFIDDLDRLEPLEVVEVLRLVRAVADFPKVGYILAYDPENLASSLKSISINDGRAFLEKIVQASFRVPNAQIFDLRNWLAAEFYTLLEGEKLHPDEEHRVWSVLDGWASRYLATPRDIVRTVNSLRLNFVPVRGLVDAGDTLFLQLVRVKNDRLFRWIQRYVAFLSILADGGEIPGDTEMLMIEELLEISGKKDNQGRAIFIDELREHFPEIISLETSEGEELSVFRNLVIDDIRHNSRDRRLTSSAHSSLYFSFTHTSGHLSDKEITSFLEQVIADRDVATAKFTEWTEQRRPQGGQMAEAILHRLSDPNIVITPVKVKGLFELLGQTMDNLARKSKPPTGYPNFLLGGRNQVFGLIELIPQEQRQQMLEHIFKTTPSLAWLTGIVRFNTKKNKSRWASARRDSILTEDELTALSNEFADRLAAEEPKKLLETPYFLDLMYAWLQVGDISRCLGSIKNMTSDDFGLLDTVEKMTNWSESSDSGVRWRIRPQTLVDFFGSFEEPIERLKTIAHNSENNKLRKRANGVLKIIDEPQ